MNRTTPLRRCAMVGGWLFIVSALELSASAAATETVLYSFRGGNDGEMPAAGVIYSKGTLYGTTTAGGAHGYGTVFSLSLQGKEHVLHSFRSGNFDGSTPYGSLFRDRAGNLYGTTNYGGPCDCGTVYKIAVDGTENVVYAFKDHGGDGKAPFGGVTVDAEGNLYGTTYAGGAHDKGAIFKIAPGGAESVIYSFRGREDGAYPFAGLIADRRGNLYGTTEYGGILNSGTVFKFNVANAREHVLYALDYSQNDGINPYGSLVRDAHGNLYGTAGSGVGFGGSAFELSASGVETVLHRFQGSDGCQPVGTMVRDRDGTLYGTTSECGAGAGVGGTVFRISVGGSFSVIHDFNSTSATDGRTPMGGLALANGVLFGITNKGGNSSSRCDCGTVFKITP